MTENKLQELEEIELMPHPTGDGSFREGVFNLKDRKWYQHEIKELARNGRLQMVQHNGLNVLVTKILPSL